MLHRVNRMANGSYVGSPERSPIQVICVLMVRAL